MFAVSYDEYGDADVLHLAEVAKPDPGPRQIRIKTMAASVNPFDWKVRAGYLAEMMPIAFPAIPGTDAAGLVDEVGADVTGITVGDKVFGFGPSTNAEYALLDKFAVKPSGLSFAQAAAIPHVTETAARGLRELGVGAGSTVLIEGAAGAVGAAAVQLAIAAGATVYGTASPDNQEYLTSLGATATPYGEGLPARLADLGVTKVDAVYDTAGAGSIEELLAMVDDPSQVVTTANFAAAAHGARVSDGSSRRDYDIIDQVADLREQHGFDVRLAATFPFSQAADAHRLSASGQARGKIVLVSDEANDADDAGGAG